MKPSASRLLRDAYVVRHEMPVRFSDLDPQNHINNVAFGVFYEELRNLMHQRVVRLCEWPRGGRIVVGHASISYLKEGRYPGAVEGCAAIGAVGGRSYVVAAALFQDGHCIGTADHTLVFIPPPGVTHIPDDMRRAMETLRLKEPHPQTGAPA